MDVPPSIPSQGRVLEQVPPSVLWRGNEVMVLILASGLVRLLAAVADLELLLGLECLLVTVGTEAMWGVGRGSHCPRPFDVEEGT